LNSARQSFHDFFEDVRIGRKITEKLLTAIPNGQSSFTDFNEVTLLLSLADF